MTTLVEFLRARLAEDEAAARAALDIERSYPAPEFAVRYEWALHTQHVSGGRGSGFAPGAPSPARVLVEVEAKRQVVDLADEWGAAAVPGADFARQAAAVLHQNLRLLATVFADHPHYDPAWRP